MPIFGRWRAGQPDKEKQGRSAAQEATPETETKAEATGGPQMPARRKALPIVVQPGEAAPARPAQVPTGGKTPRALPMASQGAAGPRPLPMANGPAGGGRGLPVMPAANS